MLPLSISTHPYFHENLDESQAKDFLLNTDKVNLLFCKTQNTREFLLCYKSSFRGTLEVRILKLSYDFNQNKIKGGSLGNLTTLYAVSQKLSKFLHGFSDEEFYPLPALKKSSLTELFQTQVESQTLSLDPISSNLIIDNIFSKLDMNSLFNAMQVSKSWYLLINNDIPAILKHQYEAENIKIAKQKEITQFVFNFIEKELKPDGEGKGKYFKRLTHNEFVLFKPVWYGISILCDVNIGDSQIRSLLIGRDFIRWQDINESVSDDIYEKLLNACKPR